MSDSTFGYYTTTAYITVTADSEDDAGLRFRELAELVNMGGEFALGWVNDRTEFEPIKNEE